MMSFFDSASSAGVKESALPMTGMTLTRGERRFMSSISSSRRPWPVGVMKYKRAWTRLSRNLGLRLILDSSAKMSSYWRSRYPTISEKLSGVSRLCL